MMAGTAKPAIADMSNPFFDKNQAQASLRKLSNISYSSCQMEKDTKNELQNQIAGGSVRHFVNRGRKFKKTTPLISG